MDVSDPGLNCVVAQHITADSSLDFQLILYLLEYKTKIFS
jgi:hypothetical protein